MADGTNWRRGIDTLQRGDEQIQQAQQANAQGRMQSAAQTTQAYGQLARTVQEGLGGIADQLNFNREFEMKQEQFRLTKRREDQEFAQREKMNPLALQKTEADIEQVETASVLGELQALSMQQELDYKATARQAETNAFDDIDKKYPPNVKTAEDRAAYNKAELAKTKAKLDVKADEAKIASTYADIGYKTAATDTQKVETALKMKELIGGATANAGALISAAKNPDTIPYLGIDPNAPGVKEAAADNRKNFETVAKATAGLSKRSQTLEQIAVLGGAKVNAATGRVDQAELDKWVSNVGGFNGLIKKIENDPKYGQIAVKMATLLNVAIKEGIFPSFAREFEMEAAQKQFGGNPLEVHTEDQAKKVMSFLFAEGKADTFFSTQADQILDGKRDVQKAFSDNHGFQYIPVDKKSGVLYDMLPESMKIPGNPGYISPQDFAKNKVPQEAASAAFGFDPKTGKPNYIVQDHWNDQFALTRQLEKPDTVSKIVANMNGANFDFGDAHLNKVAQNVIGLRQQALGMTASPAAMAGIPRDKPVTTGPNGSGYAVNPNTASPNTPTVYDPTHQMFRVVSQPSGLPAAGATPPPTDADFKRSVVQKSSLIPTWDTDTRSIFKVNKIDGGGGTAYAQ